MWKIVAVLVAPMILVILALLGTTANSPSRAAGVPPAHAADSGDWPMYGHDAQRTNYNPAESTLGEGNVAQMTQRWQMDIGPGTAPPSGAPSVANGRVFVGSSVITGSNYFAFDALTGGLAWSVPLSYTADCQRVGIGSTAAISGTTLVVGGGDAAFYALDTGDGHQIWRNPMNLGPSAFPWESPLLANGRAYLGMASYCDNPSVRGELRAVDLATGAVVNSQYFVPADEAGAGIWNSPALSADGSTLVVATGEDYDEYNGPYNRAIVTLDPLSLAIGQVHQEGSTNGDQDFATTPILFHDSQGRVLVGAQHKDNVFYTYVISDITAGAIWTRSTGTLVGMMPAYDPTFGAGGTLFFYGSSQIYAVDPASGADRWAPVTVGQAHGNMAVANGLIYVNAGNAGLRVLREADGTILRTIVPPNHGLAYSGVAVANGFIYWLSGSYLNAWSLPAGGPTPTPTPPPPSPTPCTINFADVHPSDYYYAPVQYLACHGAISGYADGTFRPYNNTTRAQMVKIVVLGFQRTIVTPVGGQSTFADVPPVYPFFPYVETASADNIVTGYACGGSGEPCDATHRPYFRPNANVTRGQLAKIVVNAAEWFLLNPATGTFADVAPGSAFYPYVETAACRNVISGYTCGGPGEPCDTQQRPYFRQYNSATRGQIAKIVYLGLLAGPACP